MFDTIVYIPTILAYVFISLLIVILAFIVIYVSHRIYACIYDNLPVAHAALSTILSMDYNDDGGIALRSPGSFNERKPKTALRIIVTLAPSYLAYVVYNKNSPDLVNTHSDTYHHDKIIKYYDRLSQIPICDTPTTTSSRKLKQKDSSSPSTPSSAAREANIATPSVLRRSIKSVSTLTTRSLLLVAPKTAETAETSGAAAPAAAVAADTNATESGNEQQVIVGPSSSLVRPSVKFVNAMNALGTIKLTQPEDVE